jgi:hypothetical protein
MFVLNDNYRSKRAWHLRFPISDLRSPAPYRVNRKSYIVNVVLVKKIGKVMQAFLTPSPRGAGGTCLLWQQIREKPHICSHFARPFPCQKGAILPPKTSCL